MVELGFLCVWERRVWTIMNETGGLVKPAGSGEMPGGITRLSNCQDRRDLQVPGSALIMLLPHERRSSCCRKTGRFSNGCQSDAQKILQHLPAPVWVWLLRSCRLYTGIQQVRERLPAGMVPLYLPLCKRPDLCPSGRIFVSPGDEFASSNSRKLISNSNWKWNLNHAHRSHGSSQEPEELLLKMHRPVTAAESPHWAPNSQFGINSRCDSRV